MRIGGPARYVIEVESIDDIPKAYEFAKEKSLPTFILGKGANTIGHDNGFDGIIIINKICGIRQNGNLITAQGGEEWDNVVEYACQKNLTGIEALSKIPGSAGAAPVQNIGAYGQDISQVFDSANVYDIKDHSFKTLQKSDFHFSYRKSILNTSEKNRYFVSSIALKLSIGQMPRPFYNSVERYITEHNCTDFTPQGIRNIVSKIRADKLPDPKEKASSGSFFKNVYLSEAEAKNAKLKNIPVYQGHDGFKINSGWLIEQAGLKGKLIHGMRINPKASLVLINESATGYSDLAKARDEIRTKIQTKFGFYLEQEPVEILDNPNTSSTTTKGVK